MSSMQPSSPAHAGWRGLKRPQLVPSVRLNLRQPESPRTRGRGLKPAPGSTSGRVVRPRRPRHAGAWIETRSGGDAMNFVAPHTRGRELKRGVGAVRMVPTRRPPHAGAWIETRKSAAADGPLRNRHESLPTRGRGLKLGRASRRGGGWRRPRTRGRGLKLDYPHIPPGQAALVCRSPTRGRGLKQGWPLIPRCRCVIERRPLTRGKAWIETVRRYAAPDARLNGSASPPTRGRGLENTQRLPLRPLAVELVARPRGWRGLKPSFVLPAPDVSGTCGRRPHAGRGLKPSVAQAREAARRLRSPAPTRGRGLKRPRF